MRVVVVTPPAPVVGWELLDQHLKLDGDTTQQPLVEAYAAAATAHIDGPDGWLGRAIGVQTLEARGDAFWRGAAVQLPYPPVISITSVTYLDAGGVAQVLPPGAYETRGAALYAAWGTSWPQARLDGEGVRIRYQAGYATVPAPIVAAILLMTDDLYRNRGEAMIGVSSSQVQMSVTVERLLAPYRVFA